MNVLYTLGTRNGKPFKLFNSRLQSLETSYTPIKSTICLCENVFSELELSGLNLF